MLLHSHDLTVGSAQKYFFLTLLLICLNFSSIKACNIGSIRLVGGSTDLEGRVEVCTYRTFYHRAIYGTVCDNLWDTLDAMVVCRQLGYTSGTPYKNAPFGQGTESIVMADVQCNGTESYLINCLHATYNYSCDHSQDAGVSCEGDSQGSGAPTGAIVGGVIGGIVFLICVCAVIVVVCAAVLHFKSNPSRAKQAAPVEYPQQEPQGYGGTNPGTDVSTGIRDKPPPPY